MSAATLQFPTGRTHLLGLLAAPPVPEQAPRVLGVDEFAFRKGWRYGTVLVGVEAARVVDVLPDRDAATFTAWLHGHPGAEIVCRDRATAHSTAIREAAPDAQEIADRWHLLHVRREALIDRVEVGDLRRRPVAAGW
ncbi:transposase [Streptomyces violascens]|uniref:transposase n=1 Tax=Streptomyces violascens TaxID=67381 RepID=UPI0036A6E276